MNTLLVISFLNELELICLHTSIAIDSTPLNGFNYCCLTLLFQFNINHLFALSEVVPLFGLMGRLFANGPGDLGSILVRVIPKTLKMVLDASLLNTQQYKVRIKGKVEQSRERNSALPYSSV